MTKRVTTDEPAGAMTEPQYQEGGRFKIPNRGILKARGFTECGNGHRCEIVPAACRPTEDGRLAFIFGSAADFCDTCDEHCELIDCTAEVVD